MKNKLYNFIALVAFITVICVGVVLYYKLTQFQMNTWQSKALIAQMQPDILVAEGQRNINNAVAFSVRLQSSINVLAVCLPYAIILIFVFYKLAIGFYEEIQKRNRNT